MTTLDMKGNPMEDEKKDPLTEHDLEHYRLAIRAAGAERLALSLLLRVSALERQIGAGPANNQSSAIDHVMGELAALRPISAGNPDRLHPVELEVFSQIRDEETRRMVRLVLDLREEFDPDFPDQRD